GDDFALNAGNFDLALRDQDSGARRIRLNAKMRAQRLQLAPRRLHYERRLIGTRSDFDIELARFQDDFTAGRIGRFGLLVEIDERAVVQSDTTALIGAGDERDADSDRLQGRRLRASAWAETVIEVVYANRNGRSVEVVVFPRRI